MYATLRAVFENIFVNGEVHDKERRDHVLDLINLERLKQLKQFFWQQVFDRFDRNRCIRHIGHSCIQLQCSPYCDIIYVTIKKSPNWLNLLNMITMLISVPSFFSLSLICIVPYVAVLASKQEI